MLMQSVIYLHVVYQQSEAHSINLFSLCFIYLTITDTVRTFQYSVANIKLEVTGKNESFLNNTYMNRNSIGMTTGSTNTIKTGLSKRKPVFLNARTLDDWGNIKYSDTARGNKLLFFEGHRFIKNNIYGSNIYWKCSKWHSNCKARAITSLEVPSKCIIKGVHNHPLALDDQKMALHTKEKKKKLNTIHIEH